MTEATTGHIRPNSNTLKNKEHALVRFGLDPDKLIQKDGRYWMTAEQLGIALGYSNPRKGVMKILERHRKELRPFADSLKVTTQVNDRNYGAKETTIFNTGGQYRIAFFAKTSKSEKFRTFVVNMLESLERQEFIHISQVAQWKKELIELRIGKQLAASSIMDWKKYNKMTRYKEMGLTQKEIAKLLDVSPRTINRFERTASQFELKLVSGGAA